MKRATFLPLIALAIVGLFTVEAGARKWRDGSGVFSVEAELVSHNKTSVKLRTPDGRELEVPLAKLSREDQQYLAGLGKRPRRRPQSLESKLALKADMAFTDLPLSDVLEFLRDAHDAPIFVDAMSLDDVGVATDSPITIARRNVTLADGLSDVLDKLDLAWTIRNHVIFVTTEEALESQLDVRVYRGRVNQDWDGIIESITTNVAPDSWSEVGGPASLSVVPPQLVVGQTRAAHQQIEKLVAGRLKRVQGQPASLAAIGLADLTKPLEMKVPTQFLEAPLEEVVSFWSEVAKADILLDEPALNDVGIAVDSPVSVNLKGLKLQDSMELTLGQLDLTWMPRRGAILITTPEQAEKALLVVRHKIVDVVVPGVSSPSDLAEAVKVEIAPETWDEVGGPASVRIGGGAMEIRQTVQHHLAIAQLLNDLRSKVR